MSNYADAIPARDDPRLPSMVSWRDPVDAGAAATSEDRWYLVIDEDGDVSVEKRTYYGDNATSEYEWHQRTLAYRILGDVIDDQRLRTDLSQGGTLANLIDCIADGHEVRWDGSNYRGYLTEDAHDASDTLRRALEVDYGDDVWSTWAAFDHLRTGLSAAEVLETYGLSIEAAAGRVIEEAITNNVLLQASDVEDALRNCIRDAREDLEDDDA